LHRDIKPSNVLVAKNGYAKLADFGLAKLAEAGETNETRTLAEPQTRPGAVMGTIAYMSPEQASGKTLDARSDIFSFGVVLYELLAARRPFTGATDLEVLQTILHGSPQPLGEEIPLPVRAVVEKALERDPAERYQSTREMVVDLRRLARDRVDATHSVAAGVPRGEFPLKWVAAAVLLLSVAAAGWRFWPGGSSPQIRSIAVLPLDNFSRDPDQEFFADGMTEQLITDLSQIGSLRVISRTSVMQYKGKRPSLPEIAKALQVDAVVEGSVLRVGDRVRITAQLLQAATDKHLWAESYDRDLRDVLALQGEVARNIAAQVQITLTPQEQVLLGKQRRVEPEVFQLYLKGRYFYNQAAEEPIRKGIEYFEQAIAKDASYAPAYAGEAFAYASLASIFAPPKEVMPKAKAAAEKALQLDETLSEAHTALAFVRMMFDWDWAGAERELKRGIELNPNSAEAHDFYGNYFTALEQYPEAITESRRAHELDPLSLRIYSDLLNNLVSARQYDETIAECKKALQVDSNFASAYAVMGLAYGQKRQFSEAIAALKKANELDSNPTMQLFLAHIQAVAGNRAEAEQLLAKMEELSKHRYVCAYEIGNAYVSLGDNNKALQWLEKGRREQCDCLVWLLSEPWMDPLRVDPRYLALVKQVGFPGK
jgi:TolB-like protein/Tfp pilus assembly protein PilF